MTPLQEQAWQLGLVLLDETAQWNRNAWPPLEGGWRYDHASVVLHHPNNTKDNKNKNNNNNRGPTVVVLGGYRQDGQIGISNDLEVVLCDYCGPYVSRRSYPSIHPFRQVSRAFSPHPSEQQKAAANPRTSHNTVSRSS